MLPLEVEVEKLPAPEVTELEGNLATQRWLLAVQLYYGLDRLADWSRQQLSVDGFCYEQD